MKNLHRQIGFELIQSEREREDSGHSWDKKVRINFETNGKEITTEKLGLEWYKCCLVMIG